jgi:hypothetical protein
MPFVSTRELQLICKHNRAIRVVKCPTCKVSTYKSAGMIVELRIAMRRVEEF